MRKIIGLFIFIISYQASKAQQFAFELWHEGKAVLESGDTLRGLIKYEQSQDMKQDIIQVKVKSQMMSYSPRKVLFFEIFDTTAKRYRQFYSLPYSENNTYKSPVFFELLVEGKLTVLCRERLEYRTVNNSINYFYGSSRQLMLVMAYFLLKPDGTISDFEGRKNNWLRLMDAREREVKGFAKDNKLDFENKYELARIIEYYNSLIK
ncbi:MAG: hypothetical protein HOP30_06545 [Cyclobacteriaceae bacterium]|nr:hypothetical protein [Cyclobacteriaceae bacterium]